MSPTDAIDKLKAGADLIQIYTGFIYEGPSIVRRINKRILAET
jgi:dihydroorotate dehydrogenase